MVQKGRRGTVGEIHLEKMWASCFYLSRHHVSFFCLTYLTPSDPAEIKLNKTGVTPTEELLEQTREEMGLNRPMLIQYGDWLKGMFKGDMGNSLRNGKPVADELLKALPQTLILTALSMAVVVAYYAPGLKMGYLICASGL